MSKFKDAKCDVCGRPATKMTRDTIRDLTKMGDTEFFEPGPVHFGCDKHPPKPARELTV